MMRWLCLIPIFLLWACSSDPALNLEQLEADARLGDQVAIVQLVGLLSKPDVQLTDRVYASLVAIGEPAVQALSEQVFSKDRQQREYVIAALGSLQVKSMVPSIAKVLADTSLERRYVAAWALGEINDVSCVAPLLSALNDENTEVRRYATRGLIKLNKLSVDPLIAYLKDAEGEGAAAAIRALGDIAAPGSLEALLAQAEGPHRGEAFLALGKLRDPRAEKALVKGLSDDDWQVRMNAAMALGPLGGPEAAGSLRITLEDDVHVVREWSARSLEMITGTPVLYRNSKDELVRPYNVYH